MLMPLVDTTQQGSPTTEGIRTTLRTLINVTRAVSSINNSGRPTLNKSATQNRTEHSLQLSTSPDDMLLNATAAILVRDQEVIALGVSSGGIVAVEGRMEEATGEPSPVSPEQHVSAAASDDSKTFAFRKSTITAIVNPRTEDNYSFPDGACCMVVGSGKSHFRIHKDDNKAWRFFLKIP
jgi:hypothetical protein